MDSKRICLAIVEIEPNLNCESNSNSIKKVWINLNQFKKLIRVRKDSKKSFVFTFKDNYLEIKKIGPLGTINKNLKYLKTDNNREGGHYKALALIKYTNKISMNKELLLNLFYELNYSNILEIETNERGIFFRERCKSFRNEILYKCSILDFHSCDLPGISFCKSYYYFFIKYFLEIMNEADIITFYNKTDYPLKFEIGLSKIDATFTYYISPQKNKLICKKCLFFEKKCILWEDEIDFVDNYCEYWRKKKTGFNVVKFLNEYGKEKYRRDFSTC